MKKKHESGAYVAYLFEKYLKNECSEDELHQLLVSIKNKKGEEQLNIVTLSFWEAVKRSKADNKIETSKIESLKQEVNDLIIKGNSKSVKRRNINPVFLKIAAAVVIIFFSSWWFGSHTDNINLLQIVHFSNKYYANGDDGVKKITLADESHLYLNENTVLHVSKRRFNKGQREVWIDDGEAFFEVTKDSLKAFIVNADDLKTIVHGTSFNIKSYSDLNNSTVSVRKGKVEIIANGKNCGYFTKNMMLTYNKLNADVKTSVNDWNNAAGWTQHRLIFCNAGLDEIKLRLKQFYDVELICKDDALKDVCCNAAFNNGAEIDKVLERLALIYNVKYKKDQNRIILYMK